MSKKIFGEIQTTEDLNELANNLRKTKEFDEIRLLCSENGIHEDAAEAFIRGEQLLLAESGHQEKLKAQNQTWNDVRAAIKKQDIPVEDITAAIERIRMGMLLPSMPEAGAAPEDKATKTTEEEPKPPLVVHTIEDVKKKLEAELEIYRDGDSKYVVEKLIELCQKDKVLLEAIMLPHKSYDKAFQCFYQQSRTVGYQMPHGNLVYLDNDAAVKLSVEYFKKDDAAEAKKRNAQRSAPKPAKLKQDNKTKAQPSKPQADVKPGAAVAKQVEPKKELLTHKEPEPKAQKPKVKEIDGQLSLFDF